MFLSVNGANARRRMFAHLGRVLTSDAVSAFILTLLKLVFLGFT